MGLRGRAQSNREHSPDTVPYPTTLLELIRSARLSTGAHMSRCDEEDAFGDTQLGPAVPSYTVLAYVDLQRVNGTVQCFVCNGVPFARPQLCRNRTRRAEKAVGGKEHREHFESDARTRSCRRDGWQRSIQGINGYSGLLLSLRLVICSFCSTRQDAPVQLRARTDLLLSLHLVHLLLLALQNFA